MFTKEYEIPNPEQIKEAMPLGKAAAKIKSETDCAIRAILDGKDPRRLLIIGPCSADSESAALRYYEALAEIAENNGKYFLIIPRIYTSKSRSLSFSYNGMTASPDCKSVNYAKGIAAARRLHIKTIENFGFSGADEMVYTELFSYLNDVVSYYVVGARCSADPFHRQIASGLSTPVGLKNDLSGNLKTLVEGLVSIKAPNVLLMNGMQYRTSGNPYVHAILRGINTEEGYRANIRKEDLIGTFERLEANSLSPSVIVDLNHGNSGKDAMKQFDSLELMGDVIRDERIKGFMIESYLYDGRGNGNGYSLTDACLGIENTKKLLEILKEKLYGGI